MLGKRISLIALSMVLLVFSAGNLGSQERNDMFQGGEELFYEVSYLGIKLGSIKIVTIGGDVVNGHATYKTQCYIDTYKGVPFVTFHATFNSWPDTSGVCSRKFFSNWTDGDSWIYDEISLEPENNKLRIARWRDKKLEFDDVHYTKRRYNEGLSLFFFARKFAGTNRKIKVPTVVNRDTASTNIYLSSKKEKVEIDAVDYPVSTVYLNGVADWKGIYGMSGKFEGWFSDDEAHVPVQAKLNVYLGSIKIELKSWKRNGWTPPA